MARYTTHLHIYEHNPAAQGGNRNRPPLSLPQSQTRQLQLESQLQLEPQLQLESQLQLGPLPTKVKSLPFYSPGLLVAPRHQGGGVGVGLCVKRAA